MNQNDMIYMMRRTERKIFRDNQSVNWFLNCMFMQRSQNPKNTTEGFILVGKTAFLGVDKA